MGRPDLYPSEQVPSDRQSETLAEAEAEADLDGPAAVSTVLASRSTPTWLGRFVHSAE